MTSTTSELRDPPLSLYVHLPWCIRKCPYCDFNSHERRGALPVTAYVDALLADLAEDLDLVGDREICAVYFGGGTPSLFPAGQIQSLLEAFDATLNLAADAEISLEANPGTIERDSFKAYRRAGINRVSLGVQSFQDDLLRALGRIHDAGEVLEALAALHAADLTNFNIDLMYGLPGQSIRHAVRDAEQAVAAQPAHVSHYQLTLEPNTAFAARPPPLPGGDDCWEMQETARGVFTAAGLENYEISAYARPGRRCRHNLNYWRYGDYLGIGAGAHAKLTQAHRDRILRRARQCHPRIYLGGTRIAECRALPPEERIFEYFLNRFRLRESFAVSDFTARTGQPWEAVRERVETLVADGLLRGGEGRYRTTGLGRRFVNDLQARFLP